MVQRRRSWRGRKAAGFGTLVLALALALGKSVTD